MINNTQEYNNEELFRPVTKYDNAEISPISKIECVNNKKNKLQVKLCNKDDSKLGEKYTNKELINPITMIGNVNNEKEKLGVTENKNSKLKSTIIGMKQDNIDIVKKRGLVKPIEKITNELMNNSYKFMINSYGHLCLYLNDNSCVEISNFDIKAKKILIRDDGVYKRSSYVVECILKKDLDKKTIMLTSDDLNDDNWVKDKLGVKYYVIKDKEVYKYFDIYLSEIFKNITEEIEYHHVGWRKINGKYVYLHAGGAIGTNDLSIRGSRDKLIMPFNLNELKSLELSLYLAKISKSDGKAIMMFVYSHLAVVKELFSLAGVEPKFVLWIYGLTGSMKTSVSKVFFNLFNRDDLSKIPATFKDTQASLEIKSFEYKDSILLVDDYHPVSVYAEKRDMQLKASNILRMYGDGISKGRSNKYMQKQAEYPPRGLCVVTGEDFIGGESTISRYIGIEVNREEFNKNILAFHQQNPLVFSQHMKYFLLWISNNFEYFVEEIKSSFYEIRNNHCEEFRHPRFGEVYSILDIMIDIIFKYMKNMGYSENNLSSDIWKNKIIKLIQEHERRTLNEDPAIMYLTAIKELIESGAIKISKMDEKNLDKKIIGYEDKEKYYLTPKMVFIEVIKFWKNQGIEFPVTENAAKKALEKIGAIEVKKEYKDGKYVIRRTEKITIRGRSSRYLVIYKNIYNKLDFI